MDFAEKLRALRKAKGYTQGYIAQELGITTRAYQNYEIGKCFPKREATLKIAQLLEVSTSYLLSFEEEFVRDAQESGGVRAKRQAQSLVAEVSGLFAGGDLGDDDKDAVMQALTEAYWDAKKRNRKPAGKPSAK